MIKIISFVGAPGCGKGFLIKYFIEKMSEQNPEIKSKIEIISIGNIIRQEIKQKTALGKLIENSKKSGCMAPDPLVTPFLRQKLHQSQATIIILDGYPRSETQLSTLEELTKGKSFNVIYRRTSEDVIRKRIAQRRVCAKCGAPHIAAEEMCSCGGDLIKRKEDDVWESRMSEYKHVTAPMIEKLKNQKKIYEVDLDDLEKSNNRASVLNKYISHLLSSSTKYKS